MRGPAPTEEELLGVEIRTPLLAPVSLLEQAARAGVATRPSVTQGKIADRVAERRVVEKGRGLHGVRRRRALGVEGANSPRSGDIEARRREHRASGDRPHRAVREEVEDGVA